MVFRALMILAIVAVVVCLLTFPWILVHFVPWKIAVLEMAATALLGVVVFWNLIVRWRSAISKRWDDGFFSSDVLLDGSLILLAAILLILPGVMTDLAGALLLIPPTRWLIVAAFHAGKRDKRDDVAS